MHLRGQLHRSFPFGCAQGQDDSVDLCHKLVGRHTGRLRKRSNFAPQPLKGRLIAKDLTASLKRCPDTKR